MSFRGTRLEEFDTLHFLGTPGAFALPYPTDRERLYVHLESEASLLASLASMSGDRVLNPGFAFAWNRTLFDPVHMIRDLASLGWGVPAVARHYDFITGLIRKIRGPEPAADEKRLLVVTSQDVLFADRPDEPLPTDAAAAAWATQKHLPVWGLNWVTVAIAQAGGRTLAYGLQPDLPECLTPDVAGDLLRRAIGTTGRRASACY